MWTAHAKNKMRLYGLGEGRVRRVIHSPERIEEGVAESTIAIMQKAGTVKNPYEIWVMIQDDKKHRKIISAWRYPGKTKPKEPLPHSILSALQGLVQEALR